MRVNASRVFDFLADTPSHTIERHEVASDDFSALRRHLRQMIVALSEGGDSEASEIAYQLRAVLSEWLTAPVRFDHSLMDVLEDMRQPHGIEARWGHDVRGHYDKAVRAARSLEALDNPVRAETARQISLLQDQGRSFRVYCHRRSRWHFDSLPREFGIRELPSDIFIHSAVEYRDTEPVDCLLKVGPLRSRGWGSAPDAVLTAPRFKTLVLVIWSGCGDEPGFGYDPVSTPASTDSTRTGAHGDSNCARHLRLTWEVNATKSHYTSRSERDAVCEVADADDLDELTRLGTTGELQRALLVQLDETHGILYPPLARVLSFDRRLQAIDYRLPGETLEAAMYLVRPIENDVRLAGLRAEEGQLSRRWKDALTREFLRDHVDLMRRLRDAGLELRRIDKGIEHWCKPATTVIHAPKQMRHFEILMNVLGLDYENDTRLQRPRVAWWQLAWDEVRRARGEAIQTGVLEHQIVDEERIAILHALAPEIRRHLGTQCFQVPIPSTQAIQGVFKFFKVHAIEHGFRAPPAELRVINELARIDRWRA